MGELEPLTVRRDRPLAVSFAAPTEDMVRHIAIRAAAVALVTAAALTSAFAAEPYLLPPPVDANVVAEGAPCPGYNDTGTPAHYVWEQGYTRKGRFQYHWACEE